MEGNVLFNDALITFYLQLYGVTHMVKYHSERKSAAATNFLLLFAWSFTICLTAYNCKNKCVECIVKYNISFLSLVGANDCGK